jgi:hypothetical protein
MSSWGCWDLRGNIWYYRKTLNSLVILTMEVVGIWKRNAEFLFQKKTTPPSGRNDSIHNDGDGR